MADSRRYWDHVKAGEESILLLLIMLTSTSEKHIPKFSGNATAPLKITSAMNTIRHVVRLLSLQQKLRVMIFTSDAKLRSLQIKEELFLSRL